MLVDTKGMIAFVGHPSTRDLEADIDKLVKGEKITGEGTAGASDEDSGDNEDAKFKDIDLE